jgi:hypothetical protein
VATAHERVNGRHREVFAHQSHELVVLLPFSAKGGLHRVFDTIRPPPALLQVRYHDMTNVRITRVHISHIMRYNAIDCLQIVDNQRHYFTCLLTKMSGLVAPKLN